MAVYLISSISRYIGVSTDAKPTGVLVGSEFFETDTKSTYICYNGTNWAEKLSSLSGDVTAKSLQVGYDGLTGHVDLYSEEGATDYVATLKPNAAMTENASFYFPAAKPAGTYFMVMTSAGIMAFDASTYCGLTGNQTLAGVKTFSSFPVTPSENPTTAYQVANKAYVDSVAVGLTPKDACRLATAAVLPACTYDPEAEALTLTGNAFGLLSIDNVEVVATNRVLVKNQADAKQNGIYTVETIGAADAYYVLKRATDYDATAEIVRGTFTYITAGSTNAGYQFIQTTAAPTLDTNNIIFGVLYAPLADTLDTVTDRGATTTNALTMGGQVNTAGLTESGIVNATATYSVLAADRHIYCRPAAGNIAINLPAATGSGRVISISKRDSTARLVTITADVTGTADSIDGKATRVLAFQYERVTLQDNTVNEWATISSKNIMGNTYLVSSAGGDFATIKQAVDWFNSSATSDTDILLGAENHAVASTITVNNPDYALQIRGVGSEVSHINAATGLTGSPMFNVTTNLDISKVTVDASTLVDYGTLANENFITWDTNNLASGLVYTEAVDVVVNNFKVGFSDQIGVDFFLFNFIVDTCGKGVEVNYSTIGIAATSTDIEVGNFIHCPVGIALTKALKDNFTLYHCIFKHTNAEVGVVYDGANYILGDASAIMNNVTNNKGTFATGFDFTIARDANMEIIGNVGEEDKTPHAKINVAGNIVATPLSASTWTKVTFTATNSYACKWTVANNRITYLPAREHDIMMWISGNVSCATNTAQSLLFGIVKNGNSATIYGQMGVTTDASSRKFAFSMNVYLEDVVEGDYFELWVRNNTGTEDPTIADLNWMTKST